MDKVRLLQMMIFLTVIGIIILSFLLIIPLKGITGFFVAEGGKVSVVNLNPEISIWQGFYGTLEDKNITDSITFRGDRTDVLYKPLSILKCYESELYITTLSYIDWSRVVPASPNEIDQFVGISNQQKLSIKSVFTKTSLFSVNNRHLLLYSTETNAKESSYPIGLLKQDNVPIFVTPIQRGRSFDNTVIDYQFMVPARYNENITYNIFLDPYDQCQTIKIIDPESIIVDEGDLVKLNLTLIDRRLSGDYLQNYTARFSAPINPDGTWQTTNYDSGVYIIHVEVCDLNGVCEIKTISVVVRDIPICGDGYCDISEDCFTCEKDCGVCIDDKNRTISYYFEDEFEKMIIDALLILEKSDYPTIIYSDNEINSKKRGLLDILNELRKMNELRKEAELDYIKNASFSYEDYYLVLELLRENYRGYTKELPKDMIILEETIFNLSLFSIDAKKDIKEKEQLMKMYLSNDYNSYLRQGLFDNMSYPIYGFIDVKRYKTFYVNGTEEILIVVVFNFTSIKDIYPLSLYFYLPNEIDVKRISPRSLSDNNKDNYFYYTARQINKDDSFYSKIIIKDINPDFLSESRVIAVINEDSFSNELMFPFLDSPQDSRIIPFSFIIVGSLFFCLIVLIGLLRKYENTIHLVNR
jgi:hypothetical protein